MSQLSMFETPSPATIAVVEMYDPAVGLRVRVRCRPGYGSQINHGREGVIARALTSGDAFEVTFADGGKPFDYIHQEDMMVTADKSGKKVKGEKGDWLDIPAFLKRSGDPAQESRYREDFEKHQSEMRRVQGSANAGAINDGTGSVAVLVGRGVTPGKHPNTPGGHLAALAEKQFGVRCPAEIEQAAFDLLKETHDKKEAKRAERGENSKADREAAKRARGTMTNLKALCHEMSQGRAERVRKRDAKVWCQKAGVALPKRFDAAHAATVRAAVEAALAKGAAGVPVRAAKGRAAESAGKGARGSAAQAAPAPAPQPVEPAAASKGGQAKAKGAAKARGGARGAPAGKAAPVEPAGGAPAPAKGKGGPVRSVRRGR